MSVAAAGRAQRFVHDFLDGTNAASALRAAAEATIDLACGTCVSAIGMDRAAYIVVAQNVAGTNNHETEQVPIWLLKSMSLNTTDIENPSQKQKQNRRFEAIPNCAGRV
jgi:predicted homoserine dehydrogenase-like protein